MLYGAFVVAAALYFGNAAFQWIRKRFKSNNE